VLDGPAAGRGRVEELTVNYRTPAAVMDVATGLLDAHGVKVAAPRSARQGQWPPIAVRLPGRGLDAVTGAVVAAVRADDAALNGGQLAVLVPRSFPAGLAAAVRAGLATAPELAKRVEVLTVEQAKGLEYDAVTVVDPAGVIADSARGLADLYVALTRPTQRLTVLHHGDLPPGLHHLDTDFDTHPDTLF
jgi:hypothetical protein